MSNRRPLPCRRQVSATAMSMRAKVRPSHSVVTSSAEVIPPPGAWSERDPVGEADQVIADLGSRDAESGIGHEPRQTLTLMRRVLRGPVKGRPRERRIVELADGLEQGFGQAAAAEEYVWVLDHVDQKPTDGLGLRGMLAIVPSPGVAFDNPPLFDTGLWTSLAPFRTLPNVAHERGNILLEIEAIPMNERPFLHMHSLFFGRFLYSG